jgi:hypothetical protein
MREALKLPLAEPIGKPIEPVWEKIEAEYRAGRSQRWLSREFGVSQSVISRRAKREGWHHPSITDGITRPDALSDAPEQAETLLAAAGPAKPEPDDFDWGAENEHIVMAEQRATAVKA